MDFLGQILYAFINLLEVTKLVSKKVRMIYISSRTAREACSPILPSTQGVIDPLLGGLITIKEWGGEGGKGAIQNSGLHYWKSLKLSVLS